MITLFSWLSEQFMPFVLPLPLRTLVLTVVLVPAMVFILVPVWARLLEPLLRTGNARGQVVRRSRRA